MTRSWSIEIATVDGVEYVLPDSMTMQRIKASLLQASDGSAEYQGLVDQQVRSLEDQATRVRQRLSGQIRVERFEIRPYTALENLEMTRAARDGDRLDVARFEILMVQTCTGMTSEEIEKLSVPLMTRLAAICRHVSEPDLALLDFFDSPPTTQPPPEKSEALP